MKKTGKPAEKGHFLQSIRSKILFMGLIALAASVLLGIMGIAAVNKNSVNNKMLAEMNAISVTQSNNQSLDISYLYFLDDSYLENILSNLDQMEKSAERAERLGNKKDRSRIAQMRDQIAQCKENYAAILDLATTRGFSPESGEYQNFLAQDADLDAAIQTIQDDTNWADGTWKFMKDYKKYVTVKGKKCLYIPYSDKMPKHGKRDWLILRVGGTNANYKGTVYMNNFMFHGADGDVPFDITKYTQEDLASSYGNGFGGVTIEKVNGIDTLVSECTFDGGEPGKESWLENFVRLPIVDVPFEKYDSFTFDVYMTKGDFTNMQVEFSLAEKYDFDANMVTLNNLFAEMMERLYFKRIKVRGCNAGNGGIAVGTNGNIYPCHRFMGMPEYIIGTLENGIDEKARGSYRSATVYNKEECKTCWARYLCCGSCAHTSAVHGGDVFHAPTCYCDIYKGLYEKMLYTYWKLKEWDDDVFRKRLEKTDKTVHTVE